MAYRPARGVNTALQHYIGLANRNKFAAKLDVSSCFPNLPHDALRTQLERHLDDDALVSLIMSYVKIPICIDGEICENKKGILQGMPLSPLLCNVYMHSLDELLEKNGISFIRYADDIVLFADTLEDINAHCDLARSFIETELHLNVNGKKAAVGSCTDITYLGHKFQRDKRGVVGFKVDSKNARVFCDWYSERPQSSKGTVSLISDGILRQKDFSLLFDTETADVNIPPAATDVINVFSDVVFDTGFLSKAMKNGITVNVFDRKCGCVGSFIPNAPLKSPKLTHEQLMAYYDEKRRMSLAKEFVLASIHNDLLNVRYHAKHDDVPEYEAAIAELTATKAAVKNASDHSKLLLLEARAQKAYYACFDLFISKDGFEFEKRSARPPQSNVNALISLGNTLLYSLIACKIHKTALDVRVGFLHATNRRMTSLNLDVAEIFRPLIVDRTVFSLINKGMIREQDFVSSENGGVYVSNDGKRIFLEAFYKKLCDTLTVKGVTMSYDSIIDMELAKLVRHFRDTEKYKGFRQVR
jgi:CRISPR-associated endonuclease Cas1 subtype I-B